MIVAASSIGGGELIFAILVIALIVYIVGLIFGKAFKRGTRD